MIVYTHTRAHWVGIDYSAKSPLRVAKRQLRKQVKSCYFNPSADHNVSSMGYVTTTLRGVGGIRVHYMCFCVPRVPKEKKKSLN